MGTPLLFFRRHHRNRLLHKAFEDAHGSVGWAVERQLDGVGRLVKFVAGIVHAHVDLEIMTHAARSLGAIHRLRAGVDTELLVVGLDGRDTILTLDAPQGSPWQSPFAEVVFDPLGEVPIEGIAFLVVEEPVVTDLVGNGMGHLSELDLWLGQAAVPANSLGLVA
ncbi:MAG: hypothetical protein WA955_06395 [Diaphorobacter nitroreducens]|uniref:hypothetical protein n=1 Tax=Diaphorobacter nitroreducens TaxID=164759 RepID=UPI003C757729